MRILKKRPGKLMKIILLHENAEEKAGETDEDHPTA
jgi:hypothetical protein